MNLLKNSNTAKKNRQILFGMFNALLVVIIIVFVTVLALNPNPLRVGASNGYLHTSGNRILDSNNNPVTITGINWFGLETSNFAPHGLWSRGYKDLLDQIKQMGFTTLRLPYSNQAFDDSSIPNGIDYTKNPDLKGLKPIEIMDKIIDYAGSLGLNVILDRHRPDAAGQSELWYTDRYSEIRWLADWLMLANRYKNNPTVIGFDLHNEPHGPACWGCGILSTDWQEAAQKAGNAILRINPNVLIIVEGVQNQDNLSYWWGGNLMGVKNHPITLDVPNKLVYSTHEYPASIYSHPWFNAPDYPENMPAVWDKAWGYIVNERIAPVLVGEFGTRMQSESDKKWLPKIMEYMSQKNIPWTFWSLNPNSGDTGGILQDDWETIDQAKLGIIFKNYPRLSTTQPQIPTSTPRPSATGSVSYSNLQSAMNYPGPASFRFTYPNASATHHIDVSTLPDMSWAVYIDFAVATDNTGSVMVTSPTKWDAYKCGTTLYWRIRQGDFYKPSMLTPIQTSRVVCPSAPTPTVQSSASAITVWWPENNVTVSGIQPFKALLSGTNLPEYDMYWSVDNGQWNWMGDNFNPSPHKEAQVDLSGWHWNANHTYTISFHARMKNTGTTTSRSVTIHIP